GGAPNDVRVSSILKISSLSSLNIHNDKKTPRLVASFRRRGNICFMGPFFRQNSAQCVLVAFAIAGAPTTANAAAIGDTSCSIRDVWANEKVRVQSGYPRAEIAEVSRSASVPAGTWSVSYKGDGVGRLRGAVRARVLRLGVLWRVDA